ncbi:cytochrome c oxidase assembly protein [Actinokineospora sp. UTMC 2448]|uniref:cytochrome c oxidase assembly protein n=1 Tax=Actinokineospora sp. UTMC 2448 TaxID=2268449 RepID=UPI002164142E|nr:cytochrome c oxidase assembly protein [Actinokineospora sp. UTMC 2448]UVS77589.1 cytochrome c oxidase assembly factor CtaG [Actinokineospora sp. UTMC 2448]
MDKPQRATGVVGLIAVGIGLAATLAALLVSLSGDGLYDLLGLPTPDAFTRHGLTVVRVLAEVGSVITIGSLLFAAFLVPPQKSGVLDVGGYGALRWAGGGALLWFVGALLSAPFLAADAVGRPVLDILSADTLLSLVGALSQAQAWLLTAAIALLVFVGTRFVLTWGWTTVLFGVALIGMTPVAVTGHSSSGGSHDMATNSLLLHLVAAALWVGGLIALLAHGRRAGANLPLAATRFSRIALVCWIVMAGSGVINALVRLPLADLFTSTYGLLVVAKGAALLVLGVFGYFQRERGVKAVVEKGAGGPLMRLAAGEVLLMLVTFGLAAGLARTPPPESAIVVPDRVELALGFPLSEPPTVSTLLFDWRFDLIFGTLALALAGLYLLGLRKLRARGVAWPVGRTVAWLAGCLVILFATSSGFGKYAPAMFSVHMQTHMMLSMLAPILLVLGAPMTLALRALPAAGSDAPPGPREWLLALVHSPVSRALTNPVVALVLFIGSFYGLYLSGLFDSALPQHWAHLAMNAHFLIVGYLFYWPVIGVDPAPRRLPHLGRLGLVFASLPFHAFFGVVLMGMQTVIGEAFYRGLALPWNSDLLADQRLGGGIAWASGEIPLLVVLIALLVQWARADDREARRSDRRVDSGDSDELEAYNAMLKKMADRKP